MVARLALASNAYSPKITAYLALTTYIVITQGKELLALATHIDKK